MSLLYRLMMNWAAFSIILGFRTWPSSFCYFNTSFYVDNVNLRANLSSDSRNNIFYETVSGQKPIEKFIDQLSAEQAKKVAWVLNLIEELERVPAKYFKKLVNTEDLWEVRVNAGTDTFRFIGFFDGLKLIVLAHAFQKKTQKTPKADIRLVQNRKKDYLRREAQ